ncbi:MAG: hypothetical protein KBT47_04415 [Armatimonadetes bacterium]|nr:hypothetical protein [Candidatus Hippobium faecium]
MKYLGVAAVACCLIIGGYYIYIESWMLGYAGISLTGYFNHFPSEKLGDFLGQYVSFDLGTKGTVIAVSALVISAFLNFYFVACGISKGVSRLIRWSMPVLLVMALVILVKVLLTPGIGEGIKYMFRGNISDLLNLSMWMDAAGQMFFSLSVGFTATMVYVTYSKNNLNLFKDGLSSAFMNMGIEVFIASFIAIPVSFLAFGDKMEEVVHSSSIAFGMVSMSSIFSGIPGGSVWCFLWFFLLFVAALTSSVSMVQVFISFFCDKFGITRFMSAIVSGILWLCVFLAVILVQGGIDEFDFWTNLILMPIGALMMIFIVWTLGDKFGKTFNENSKMKIGFFEYLIKIVTPLYLLAVMIPYVYKNGWDIITCKNYESSQLDEIWILRGIIILYFIVITVCISRKNKKSKQAD